MRYKNRIRLARVSYALKDLFNIIRFPEQILIQHLALDKLKEIYPESPMVGFDLEFYGEYIGYSQNRTKNIWFVISHLLGIIKSLKNQIEDE